MSEDPNERELHLARGEKRKKQNSNANSKQNVVRTTRSDKPLHTLESNLT